MAAVPADAPPHGVAELRGTWLTTTANRALATPADTARTMRRLREIGLNTVYVECWKNGYTQYPSEVLRRTIGVAERPPAALQDPSDRAGIAPPRDLLFETLTEAHRNGLVHIAWFEYGFMAAHQHTMNHLRRLKPQWLSRDRRGSEVAPNGFVWMNPLHTEVQEFLLALVLEAVDRYDLDGVQLDDRIVWPYVTMGYDETTRALYAAEHRGAAPPDDAQDPAWMAWRAAKVDAFARSFTRALHEWRPGLVVSLSPAVYPWSWDHYLLDWPRWMTWEQGWDEVIPQAYRFSWEAFERTWQEQTEAVTRSAGAAAARQRLLPGIRIVGEGADSSWDQLRRSIELARTLGQRGHVLWFSRGVLDLYANELQQFYAASPPAHSPRFARGWRPAPIELHRQSAGRWEAAAVPAGHWRAVRHDGQRWWPAGEHDAHGERLLLELPVGTQRAELLRDRRGEFGTALAYRQSA